MEGTLWNKMRICEQIIQYKLSDLLWMDMVFRGLVDVLEGKASAAPSNTSTNPLKIMDIHKGSDNVIVWLQIFVL